MKTKDVSIIILIAVITISFFVLYANIKLNIDKSEVIDNICDLDVQKTDFINNHLKKHKQEFEGVGLELPKLEYTCGGEPHLK